MRMLAIALAVAALAACSEVHIQQTSVSAGTTALTDNARPDWERDPRRGDYPHVGPGY